MGMTSASAFRAGLLLLVLALICAAGMMMKAAAYGVDSTAVRTITLPHDTLNAAAYYGDETPAVPKPAASKKLNAARRALVVREGATTSGDSSARMQVATAVALGVGAAQLNFTTQQLCVSVDKKAQKALKSAKKKSATAWWKGTGASGSASAGGQCARVKLFGKVGCQGPPLDSIANPRTPGSTFPSTQKDVPKLASVASVLCDLNVSSSDPACAALGCDPGGTCQVDQSSELFCQWDTPCGSCPKGATCKTSYDYGRYWAPVPVQYCMCPQGYGMYDTTDIPGACIRSGEGRASSFSLTLIANETAKDRSSRPYTFRLDKNICTQIPDAVAGKVTAAYIITINNGYSPICYKVRFYPSDNCFDDFTEWNFGFRIATSYWSYQDMMNPEDKMATAIRNMRSAVCLVEGRDTYP
ncbi:unnamed protein product [Closterium sp. Yama58-4]|nr:unnamed protein product [Closterium sp. Yama58-4]